jgi:hypothetical protein
MNYIWEEEEEGGVGGWHINTEVILRIIPEMVWFSFMVFNAIFNNISVISWWSVLFGVV